MRSNDIRKLLWTINIPPSFKILAHSKTITTCQDNGPQMFVLLSQNVFSSEYECFLVLHHTVCHFVLYDSSFKHVFEYVITFQERKNILSSLQLQRKNTNDLYKRESPERMKMGLTLLGMNIIGL